MTAMRTAAAFALIGVGLLAGPAEAEVTQFETVAVERPALQGRSFGERGTAEKIAGRATIALDPADPHNAVIADLALAPRNADGRVEAVADVVLLRPERPNGLLLVEIPNRGRKLIGPLVEGSSTEASGRLQQAGDAGRGFLLSRGYTLAWIGWQGDIAPGAGMGIRLPVLSGVTGPSREEWVFDHTKSPVEATLTWPAADLDPAKAHLTVRAKPEDPRTTPAGLSFRYLDAHRIEITRPEGFDGSALYELSYTARDPAVMGLGLAAIRDVATFLRHDASPQNPLASGGRSGIDRAIGFGISQSGRVLRDLLYLGLNEDERGRMVFDGMMPHIAGSRRSFTNARFAQPGRNPAPHLDRYYPADQFPFAYAVTTDALTGRRDGLFLRCRLSNTCPRLMHVDSEYEMWGSRGALVTTDTSGAQLDQPPEVRVYMVTGAPHFANPNAKTMSEPGCALPVSPVHAGAASRALLAALETWVADGIEPPASRYPSRADGTLGVAAHLYPPIPGLPYAGLYNPAQWVEQGDPPAVRGTYPLLLPKIDQDGNTLAGIRLPLIEVPRATYTAWNPTRGVAAETLCNQKGGVLAFLETRAAARAASDPRPSLEERYPDPGTYAAAVRAAAARMVAERTLLPADAEEMSTAAEKGQLAQ
ncbi:alpha/beta hydrolase domain-containing protein [Methylobacterium sp. WSM2598]|uniref:alpha/beta hydrolase domain-containing protein n=1 Tax=Methylobacterium sp. WSM2598 TaxID=398261 RepID=UPI00037EB5A7|nr:alpha/beta hydrolase domain-containing protein [Methylobacterium sp. WSM2598]